MEKRLMQALRRACALDSKTECREDIAALIIAQVEPIVAASVPAAPLPKHRLSTVPKGDSKDDPRLTSPVRQLLRDAISHRDTRISVRMKVLARLEQCVRPTKGKSGKSGRAE